MRGALIDATLPVVMRRTCVCPSRLFSAATKALAMQVEVGLVRSANLFLYVFFAPPTCSSARHADEARAEMLGDHFLERPQNPIIKMEVNDLLRFLWRYATLGWLSTQCLFTCSAWISNVCKAL